MAGPLPAAGRCLPASASVQLVFETAVHAQRTQQSLPHRHGGARVALGQVVLRAEGNWGLREGGRVV